MPEHPGTIHQMGSSPASIQQSIEQAREEIASSMLALRDRVNQAADWRGWVQRRPKLTGGVAFSLGVILGLLSNKSKNRRQGTRFAQRGGAAQSVFLRWLKL